MRRLLLLLFVALLPYKAVASAVVTIVGAPKPLHAPAAAEHRHGEAHGAGQAGAGDESGDRLHDHHCPHLAMSMLAAGSGALEPERAATVRPAGGTPLARSVVLDVPRPPPTAIL